MSFNSLRSSRKAKESRSFVQRAAARQHDLPVVPTQTSGDNLSSRCKVSSKDAVPGSVEQQQQQQQQAPLAVRESSIAGRGMFAGLAWSPGTVITTLKPHVSVVSTPYLEEYCTNCTSVPRDETKLRRCTRCRVVEYCDDKCQTIDWAIHKHECKALQKWAESAPKDMKIPSDAIRCLGRILWGFKTQGLDSMWTTQIKEMQSHRASLPPSAFESHAHLAQSLVRYLGVGSPLELEPYGIGSTADLVDVISRFTTNAFTLTSYSLNPIGVAVSPIAACINHSCEPNAVVVFPRISDQPHMQEPQMNLVVIRPIAADEEITISYIDVTLPRDIRQGELKETYNFECNCILCLSLRPDDPCITMLCPVRCGGTRPITTEGNPPPPCRKCKAVTGAAEPELDALNVGQEALDKATAVQHADPQKAVQLTTNIIPILTSAGLTPSCHPLLAMTRLHLEFLIGSLPDSMTQRTLDEAIRTAVKYVAGLSAILPSGHPVRGVALAELGKLLAVDEPAPYVDPTVSASEPFPPSGPARLRLAQETLVRAREELVVGFGMVNGGGRVGREVRETIVRLERELGTWSRGIKNALEDAMPRTPRR